MSKITYFAYGSNMSSLRLKARVPSSSVISTAVLHKHSLAFHKESFDGSSKCHIEYTQLQEDIVHGVVYRIALSEKPYLDEIEGLGNGYEEKQVPVIMPSGDIVIAYTYYATHINTLLEPYHWYKEHVIRGALEHGLPGHYIDRIESVISVPDPDPENHTRELAIYS
ncbi:MAG: gamma-glutamylcyclotransferase [Gammaproteobacteria bacterium]|jgi:gamma-glutamylcyclotransferase (GGCT)/AIG2-like uncharacterized protein YtfP